jgi:membrane protein DedA with SNARE-associated domain
LLLLVALAAAGTILGDHILYWLGCLGGDKILALYCRWTIGSSRCIADAREYFARWGGATIVIGRFVTGVRIFASALAGAGGISYPRFLFFDVVGALVWSGVCVGLGYILGERAGQLLERYGSVVLFIGAALIVGTAAVIGWRVWKRRRHRPATMARATR